LSETLTSEDLEGIMEYNRLKVEKDGELFEVEESYIYNSLPKWIDSHNRIQDKRTRIIKKATEIMAGITYYQPFFDANKRTALTATILFLEKYSFTLPMYSLQFQKEIYDLLNRTILKPTNDPSILEEVEHYIENTIISLD
jgi:prophage maintenance system killer protein